MYLTYERISYANQHSALHRKVPYDDAAHSIRTAFHGGVFQMCELIEQETEVDLLRLIVPPFYSPATIEVAEGGNSNPKRSQSTINKILSNHCFICLLDCHKMYVFGLNNVVIWKVFTTKLRVGLETKSIRDRIICYVIQIIEKCVCIIQIKRYDSPLWTSSPTKMARSSGVIWSKIPWE